MSDGLVEICLDACKAAKRREITVSCNLNYRKNLWSSEKAKSVMKTLMPYVDVCVANEEDADKVLGNRAVGTDVESGQIYKAGYQTVAYEICKEYGYVNMLQLHLEGAFQPVEMVGVECYMMLKKVLLTFQGNMTFKLLIE